MIGGDLPGGPQALPGVRPGFTFFEYDEGGRVTGWWRWRDRIGYLVVRKLLAGEPHAWRCLLAHVRDLMKAHR